ncbi:hypothetical protein AAFF_G00356020 [Aldrovandia affinis]|uniref:Uncharacterized protein n=1 Tax=Aldrovandia affinis TaxID=143900 RepID=A0AAD7R5E2_9TELE|nr:hypothetical protein AAFF_G00356020 [Aldrovandia affinis]
MSRTNTPSLDRGVHLITNSGRADRSLPAKTSGGTATQRSPRRARLQRRRPDTATTPSQLRRPRGEIQQERGFVGREGLPFLPDAWVAVVVGSAPINASPSAMALPLLLPPLSSSSLSPKQESRYLDHLGQ